MSNPSTSEQIFVQDFEKESVPFWQTNNDYDTVNALLLYWEEDDLNVKDEVQKFKKLLLERFNYYAEIYLIKSKDSTLLLQLEIGSFIKTHARESRSLIIVFYAGHADDSSDMSPPRPGYSVWRATENPDSPRLNWMTPPHELLYNAAGDVLLILDCCHAMIKTRGYKKGRMEVFAACGSDSKVPEPGRLSFTTVLVREMRKYLQAETRRDVRWLCNHMWSQNLEYGLTVSPVCQSLSEEDHSSIVLQPLPDIQKGFAKKKLPPSSFMFLRVTLTDDPVGSQIARWLKSFSPKTIHSVDIEGLVLKARKLENLKDRGEIFTGSILGRLSVPAQKEIIHQLQVLSNVVSDTAVLADEDTSAHGIGEQEIESHSSTPQAAEHALQSIVRTVDDVRNSIESGIVLDPNVELKKAAKDELVIAADAQNAITLRQFLLDAGHIPDGLELQRQRINYKLPAHTRGNVTRARFRHGTIDEKPILLESFPYVSENASQISMSKIDQIRRMVQQLSLTKDGNFQVLPCIGYVHEKHLNRIAIVFDMTRKIVEAPTQILGPITLSEVLLLNDKKEISKTVSGEIPSLTDMKRVPLGQRIYLAYMLAQSLNAFHRVEWVHKEFKSNNIAFFRTTSSSSAPPNTNTNTNLPQHTSKTNTDTTSPNSNLPKPSTYETIDLTQPYIFGFEYSRPEQADSDMQPDFSPKSNAYRHPERWGIPRGKFEKAHDVYSLGITLIELAFWKSILSPTFEKELQTQPPTLSNPLLPGETTKLKLLSRVQRDLPHMAGQSFTNAIVACLTFKEKTTGFNSFRMNQYFKSEILYVLRTAAVV